jgi:hypothetical protein
MANARSSLAEGGYQERAMEKQEKQKILEDLLAAEPVPMAPDGIGRIKKDPGLYLITCDVSDGYLYAGKAGRHGGEGTRGRVRKHRVSSGGLGGDNLARALAKDGELSQAIGGPDSLATSARRREFFAEHCDCRTVTSPDFSDQLLSEVETFVIGRLCPRLNVRDNPRLSASDCGRAKDAATHEPASALGQPAGSPRVPAALLHRVLLLRS